jgi:hypothetical protein
MFWDVLTARELPNSDSNSNSNSKSAESSSITQKGAITAPTNSNTPITTGTMASPITTGTMASPTSNTIHTTTTTSAPAANIAVSNSGLGGLLAFVAGMAALV